MNFVSISNPLYGGYLINFQLRKHLLGSINPPICRTAMQKNKTSREHFMRARMGLIDMLHLFFNENGEKLSKRGSLDVF